MRDALLRSLCIGQLPLVIAAENVAPGRLIPMLPNCPPLPVPVHAVYPSNRYLSPKVRAFIDLALTRCPAESAQAREVTAKACLPARGKPAKTGR